MKQTCGRKMVQCVIRNMVCFVVPSHSSRKYHTWSHPCFLIGDTCVEQFCSSESAAHQLFFLPAPILWHTKMFSLPLHVSLTHLHITMCFERKRKLAKASKDKWYAMKTVGAYLENTKVQMGRRNKKLSFMYQPFYTFLMMLLLFC